MKKLRIAALAVAGLLLAGCAEATQPGQAGVVIDGDMFPTDPAIIGCMAPETSETHIFNDVYRYPARQISWDATGAPGSERGPYSVVSSAEAPTELNVPVVITMDMTSDCELLKNFHRNIGTKYSAWLDDDNTVSEGWIAALGYIIGQPLEVTLDRVAQRYSWQDLWNSEAVRVEMENTLRDELPANVLARSGGNAYFTNLQVSVLKPDPVNPALKDALAKEQSVKAEGAAARAQAEAELLTAESQTKVAQQQALQKQAEIAGFPTIEDYLKSQLIARGGNPYQPTWVVPGVPQ